MHTYNMRILKVHDSDTVSINITDLPCLYVSGLTGNSDIVTVCKAAPCNATIDEHLGIFKEGAETLTVEKREDRSIAFSPWYCLQPRILVNLHHRSSLGIWTRDPTLWPLCPMSQRTVHYEDV